MRLSSLTSVIVASTASLVAAQTSDSCTLNCQNETPCRQGEADYSNEPKDINGLAFSFHKETSHDGWYCECPDEFTGVRCNRPVERCPNTTHVCYNGGKCIHGIEGITGPDEYFCNCDGAEHNGVPYVGKYCETEGAVLCGGEDSEVFCTQGGSCKPDAETKAHPCNCLAGKRGPHCEFDTGFVPDCVLDCQVGGGECMLGIKSYEDAKYDDFWARHDGNFQYCECPEGRFGHACEITGVECGDKHCFNGGKCKQTTNTDGKQTFACDCRTAQNEFDSFGGEACESISTEFCDNDPLNGNMFCVNGGKCKEPKHEGCECADGFHGPICEFRDKHHEEKQECSLQCENGGTCRNGVKDVSFIENFGPDLSQYAEEHNEVFQHCVCPEGFFGVKCEHEVEICPGDDFVCMHGSKCVPSDAPGETYKCDCDEGFTPNHRVAGRHCQHRSTDICTKGGTPGAGRANFAFCVNGGQCKDYVNENQKHPGCLCDPEHTGDHCEFLTGNEPAPVPSPSNQAGNATTPAKDSGNGLLVVLGAGMVVVGAIAAVLYVKKRAESGIETNPEDNLATEPVSRESSKNSEAAIPALDGEMNEVQIC